MGFGDDPDQGRELAVPRRVPGTSSREHRKQTAAVGQEIRGQPATKRSARSHLKRCRSRGLVVPVDLTRPPPEVLLGQAARSLGLSGIARRRPFPFPFPSKARPGSRARGRIGEAGIEGGAVLGADRQGETVLDGMQEDEVAQHVALDRLEESQPLLSSRLNRLVRQKPMRRRPARERSARVLASAGVGGSRRAAAT